MRYLKLIPEMCVYISVKILLRQFPVPLFKSVMGAPLCSFVCVRVKCRYATAIIHNSQPN